MERIRSWTGFALGGAGRFALAAVGTTLLAGVGCTGARMMSMKEMLPAGWVESKPATHITPAFNPQLQYLPDPSQDGAMRPGLVGQMFLVAEGGSFTDANGDLYVMADDITPRAPGQPSAVPEVWHFDPVTLRKLRTKDERFGDCYALFLPYPSNWKDVAQVRITTRYEPKGDRTKEPVLTGPPQTLLLDFTPPGQQPDVWLDKGTKVTSPIEMRGMPNVSRDIARGGFGAPLTGPQPNTGAVPTGGMVPTGGVPPAGGMTPAGGPTGPLPPAGMNPAMPFTNPAAGATPPPAPTTPQLPPPMQFTPDRPQASVRGPNGETLNVTAVALPPGQTVPNGWTKQPDGSIQPPNVAASQQSQQFPSQPGQVQQTWPAQAGYTATAPAAYQPASAGFVPASERTSRIQHGAFNQPQQQHSMPSASGQSAPLPPLPSTAMPQNRSALPVTSVPGGAVPPVPTNSGGWSGPNIPGLSPLPPVGAAYAPAPPNFDPNLPVGAWANQPAAPIMPPSLPGTGGVPTVVPPVVNQDAPLPTHTIRAAERR